MVSSGRAAAPLDAWLPLGRWVGVRWFVSPGLLIVLVGVPLLAPGWAAAGYRAMAAALLLAGIVVHEAGHALAAARRGLAVGGVYLNIVSFAYVERGRPHDELRVALAGPLASLCVGALLAAAAAATGDLQRAQADLALWWHRPLLLAAAIQLLMGSVNLVPALPADGGRVLRAFLATRFGAPVPGRIAGAFGMAIGALIALASLVTDVLDPLWFVLLGVYFAGVGVKEWHMATRQAEARPQRSGPRASHLAPPAVPAPGAAADGPPSGRES